MKLRLSMLLLLVSGIVTAQPGFTLKSGEELSQSSQYGRSTQALEAFIEANPARLYDQSQALLLISYNHMQLGDYTGALEANEASLRIKAKLHADDLVNNYVRFGAIHLLRGNYHAALSYLLRAKDFPIEALQLYAIIDAYLAAAYRGLAQFEQAEIYYRQSIETLMIEYPEDDPTIITTFYHLGKLYLEWDRPEVARQYFQLGLDRSQSTSRQTFLRALLNNGLGETFADQPQTAEIYHRKALDIAIGLFGSYHRETATAGLLLARSLSRQNRRDEARDAILLAIRSLTPEQPRLGWNQLPDTSRLVLDQTLLAEALGYRADWFYQSALPDEIRLPSALANSEYTARLLQAAMDDRIDQADRMKLLPVARHGLEAGIAAGIQLWQQGGDKNAQWRALELAEVVKVLSFRAHTGRGFQLQGVFAERERALLRELHLAEMDFRLQPLDLTVSREVSQLRNDYRRLKEEWKQTDLTSYRQRFGVDRRPLRELPDRLAPDHMILTYFSGSAQSYLFTLDRDGLQTFIIDTDGLSENISAFLIAVDSSAPGEVAGLGHQLYQQLLAPAAARMKGKDKLSIVPDEPFESLPFEALLSKPYRKNRVRWHKLPYLIKERAVQYRHTTGSWESLDAVPSSYEFLFVAPVFDEEQLALIDPDRRVLFDPIIHSGSLISDGKRFRPMESATKEANRLQVIWGQNPAEGRFKLREAASELLLKTEIGRAHYVHLASYSFVEGPSPEEAGLVLANTDSSGDGTLLGSELAINTASATDLITIDFTETSKSPGGTPIAILPLSGSLMLSGIPHIVYNERLNSNGVFYPMLYEQLLTGKPIGKSVQEVKENFARQKDTAAPRYWSSFRLLVR